MKKQTAFFTSAFTIAGMLCCFFLISATMSCSNLFGDMLIKKAETGLSSKNGGITLSAGEYPVILVDDFDLGKKIYTIEVLEETETLQLNAQTDDPSARLVYSAARTKNEKEEPLSPPEPVAISSNGKITALPDGTTEVTITIIAEDDDFKNTYIVRIEKKASTVSLLSMLSFTAFDAGGKALETPVLPFYPTRYEYPSRTLVQNAAHTVLPESETLSISATAKNAELTGKINVKARFFNGTEEEVTDLQKIPLRGGITSFVITVPAYDTKTEGIYTLHVKKPRIDDASLQDLTVTGTAVHEITPVFGASSDNSYTAYITETSVRINAKPSHQASKIVFSSDNDTKIDADGTINGFTTDTRVTITVTAPDGVNTCEYTLNLIKPASIPSELNFRIDLHTANSAANTPPADVVSSYTWDKAKTSYTIDTFSGAVQSLGVTTTIIAGAEQVEQIEYKAWKKDGSPITILKDLYNSDFTNNTKYMGLISAGISGGEKLPDGTFRVTATITLTSGEKLKPYTYYMAKPDVSDPTLTDLKAMGITPSSGFLPAVTVFNLLDFKPGTYAYTINLPTEVTGITFEAVTTFLSRPTDFPSGALVTATAVNNRHENIGTENVTVDAKLTHSDDLNKHTTITLTELPAGATTVTVKGTSADKEHTKDYTITINKPDVNEPYLKRLVTGGSGISGNINEKPASATSKIEKTAYNLTALTETEKITIIPDAYYKPAEITYSAKNKKVIGYNNGSVTDEETEVGEITTADGKTSVPLGDGVTTVTMNVKTTDKKGTPYTKEYTITITKPEINNANLRALRLSGGFTPDQSMVLITEHSEAPRYDVSNKVTEITVVAETTYKDATISAAIEKHPEGHTGDGTAKIDVISGNTGSGGTVTKKFSVTGLQSGNTRIAVTVTPKVFSGSESDKKTYYVTVFKASGSETVTLRSLKVGGTALGISTDPKHEKEEILIKDLTSAKELTIELEAYNTDAQITVSAWRGVTGETYPHEPSMEGIDLTEPGEPLTGTGEGKVTYTLTDIPGDASQYGTLSIVKIALSTGSAESAKKIYYLKIYNKKSDDASLKNLSASYSSGEKLTLSPAFAEQTTYYTADFSIHKAESVVFTAETKSSLQTVSWNTSEVKYVADPAETITETTNGNTLKLTLGGYRYVKTITLTVTVTAESGKTQTYSIKVSNKLNNPALLEKVPIFGKDYLNNTDQNRMAFRFGTKKAAGYRSVQDTTHGDTLTGLNILGSVNNGTDWIQTAFGTSKTSKTSEVLEVDGGWNYFVNGKWVPITKNSVGNTTDFVPVPENSTLQFGVEAYIVYADSKPYVIVTHKVKNTSSVEQTVSFGAYCDTAVAGIDTSPFTLTKNGCTLSSGGYVFELYARGGLPGVDAIDKLWLGEFDNNNSENNPLDTTNGFMVSANEQTGTGGTVEIKTDSAAAYAWENVSVPARGTVSRTLRFTLRQ